MIIIKNQCLESIIQIKVESIIKAKYTPAITIVELCKRAEIGVGADIAFNNQEEKGNWADLEKNIKSKHKEIQQCKDRPESNSIKRKQSNKKENIKVNNKLKRIDKGTVA